jgi:hypothetical protein
VNIVPGKQVLSINSLLQSLRGSAVDRAAIRQVMDCTDALVDYALKADWSSVLDVIERRRRLLQRVIDSDAGNFDSEVSALSAAVTESERAMIRVIAHAIASTRWNGAAFKMYH